MEAAAGDGVTVEDDNTGAHVEVERAFLGGEEVIIDCGAGRAWVDGEAADSDVTLDSDFFWLEPVRTSCPSRAARTSQQISQKDGSDGRHGSDALLVRPR